MGDYESRAEDARRERYIEKFEAGEVCLSGDPYCANNPSSRGTYERYKGELCDACREGLDEEEDLR